MRLPSDDGFCLEDVELDGASTRHGSIEARAAARGGCGGQKRAEDNGSLRGVRALLRGLRGVDAGERWSRRRRRKEVVCYKLEKKQRSARQPVYRGRRLDGWDVGGLVS